MSDLLEMIDNMLNKKKETYQEIQLKKNDLQEEIEIPNAKKESKYERNDLILPDSDTLRKFCRDLGFRGKNLRLVNRGHTKLIIEYLMKILLYL